MIGPSRKNNARICSAVLAGLCAANVTFAEVPVKEQDVLDLFLRREQMRNEQKIMRSYAAPISWTVFDACSLEHQLWQNQWWLQKIKDPQPAGKVRHCQPPCYIPSPPFKQCLDRPLY